MSTLELGLLKCDCGKPALSLCGTNPECTLIPCMKPVCGENGGWSCKEHRHKNGTMGYPHWQDTGVVTWQGFEPDEPGWWPALKAKLFVWFASPEKAAQRAWDDVRKQFPAPSPMPLFIVRIGKRYFEGCTCPGYPVHEVFGFDRERKEHHHGEKK